MITKANLKNLRLMEFLQVMNNIGAFLAKENLEQIGLKTLTEDFNQKRNALNTELNTTRKSEHTERLTELDQKRDNLLTNFVAHAKLFTQFPDVAKAEQAKKLVFIVEKYGKSPQKRTLREETALIKNLLADLEETSAQNAINSIGAEQWLTHLKQTNSHFETLHTTRTEEQGAIETGKTKELRTAMQESFVKLATAINGLVLVNGEDKYKTLANSINEEVKTAMSR